MLALGRLTSLRQSTVAVNGVARSLCCSVGRQVQVFLSLTLHHRPWDALEQLRLWLTDSFAMTSPWHSAQYGLLPGSRSYLMCHACEQLVSEESFTHAEALPLGISSPVLCEDQCPSGCVRGSGWISPDASSEIRPRSTLF